MASTTGRGKQRGDGRPHAWATYLVRAAEWALGVALVLAVALFVVHAVRALSFPFPLDYGEGPLLEQGRILAAGGSIYRAKLDDYPFTIANYPPVFPSVLAITCKLFGPSYVAGRVVTTCAAAGCALLVGAIVRAASPTAVDRDDRAARLAPAIAGGALFLAVPYVVFWASLVRVDLLALAFCLGALWAVARAPLARATPFVCAGLLGAAVLTRQSHLLAGPLAATVALWRARPAQARRFLLTFAATSVLAFALLDLATSGAFYFNVVTTNVNPFSMELLAFRLKYIGRVAWPLLLFGAAYLANPPPAAAAGASARVLASWYLIGATISGLTIGKVGSNVNYFLEAAAALAIAAGVSLDGWRRAGRIGPRLTVTAALTVAAAWMWGFAILRPEITEQKLGQRDEFAALTRVLWAEPGRVLADETMGLLVLSGHDIMLQPFEFTQLAHKGLWDQTKVVGDIRAQRFALILVNETPATPAAWTRERWTDEMLAAVHDRYAATGTLANATLYRPKPPGK